MKQILNAYIYNADVKRQSNSFIKLLVYTAENNVERLLNGSPIAHRLSFVLNYHYGYYHTSPEGDYKIYPDVWDNHGVRDAPVQLLILHGQDWKRTVLRRNFLKMHINKTVSLQLLYKSEVLKHFAKV